MSRSRYEAVPQADTNNHNQNPPILLDPIISGTSTYNYNSGVPTSAPSSHRTPSISSQASRSPPPSFHSSQFTSLNAHQTSSSSNTTPFPPFTNSAWPAPPSFHSRSSTPRPTPSAHTIGSTGSGVELWGLAPSTVTGAPTDTDDEEEGAMTVGVIRDLKRRVERLEESLGRLLLENETLRLQRNNNNDDRNNCCVTFTDVSGALEQNIAASSNCCVRFTSSSSNSRTVAQHRHHQRKQYAAFGLGMAMVLILLTVLLASGGRGGRRGEGMHVGSFAGDGGAGSGFVGERDEVE